MMDNLPVPDDAPWLNLSQSEIEQLRNQKQQITEYGMKKIRKLMNKNYIPDDDVIEEMTGQKLTDEKKEELARLREENAIIAKISDEDLKKIQDAAERQKLAIKTFDELVKDEKIKLALEELAAIVMGGQDGEEFYNSVKFIKDVLESFQ